MVVGSVFWEDQSSYVAVPAEGLWGAVGSRLRFVLGERCTDIPRLCLVLASEPMSTSLSHSSEESPHTPVPLVQLRRQRGEMKDRLA